MRAICKVCNDKETCSYIKRNREGDCIDVQTSDYGYEEAVEKTCEYLRSHIFGHYPTREKIIEDFRKAMEGE